MTNKSSLDCYKIISNFCGCASASNWFFYSAVGWCLCQHQEIGASGDNPNEARLLAGGCGGRENESSKLYKYLLPHKFVDQLMISFSKPATITSATTKDQNKKLSCRCDHYLTLLLVAHPCINSKLSFMIKTSATSVLTLKSFNSWLPY